MKPAPGEVVLEHASRAFSVRADSGRTLKELVVGALGRGGPPPVQALRDVSLHVRPGETVGMVGRNGAGKSSTLRVLAGIVPLQGGRVACGGRVVSLLELGAGFGRDFSGRENIYLNGALHGFSKPEIEERVEEIVDFSELEDFIDVPVKTYSSGMFVRLGFAIAAYLDADVLLIDEVLAVGDEAFQRKCLRRISERIAAGATLVLVSHDAGAIERVCERVVVLDEGRVLWDGPTAEGLLFYHRLMGTEHGAGASVRPTRDRAVAVHELELQDEDGRRREVFAVGAPLRVVLSLAARERVERAVMELRVTDESGKAVFATRAEADLQDGGALVVYDVPRLALLGGDYDLSVGADDAARGDAPSPERVSRFSVAAEPGAEGVADLRGTWSVGAGASAGVPR